MTSTKPYDIAKRTIREAYRRVKANRSAAGIDGETIAMFEQDLSRNLYKLWNRMSSGSYFPPPVKQVEIPKATGGSRKLGVPTVADRVGQTAVKLLIEPILDPLFHADSYGYRPTAGGMWVDDASGEVEDRLLQGPQPHPGLSECDLHILGLPVSAAKGADKVRARLYQLLASR